ncbi:Acetyl esterase/lipase [Halomicrobium zhouii]|uniref:Acetyl esterase/lipase n=1 Tax=Halomicrobium zhouii TaxID=767519 RepID=A0A1I6K3F5_9EURY|nr:alpha/beta hydrolase [Halomicrobium zhouii]SFR85717.1 Acetyl esterase/lipase [Halomicrobium zhouii]
MDRSSDDGLDGFESDDGRPADSGDVRVHEGITYAERDVGDLQLDLFVPEREDPPLVVYFHGGAWVMETRDNVPHPARYAAELGYAIASVDYRLSAVPDGVELEFPPDPDNTVPRGVFPDHFVDAKASIRWLRANADEFGYDAERVAAWGASAGGHLAALAGVVDDVTDLAGEAYAESELAKDVAPEASGAVQAVIDWYGVNDLSLTVGEPGTPEALLIGGSKAENEAKYEAASPVTHVTPDDPPFLLMHGRADEVVSVDHSRVLADALADAGVDAALYELHGLNHVFAHGDAESIESERVAMELLTDEPTPAQSVSETVHVDEGEAPRSLIEGTPRAGPVAIKRFLDATIGV